MRTVNTKSITAVLVDFHEGSMLKPSEFKAQSLSASSRAKLHRSEIFHGLNMPRLVEWSNPEKTPV
jgi:hypothetical protein